MPMLDATNGTAVSDVGERTRADAPRVFDGDRIALLAQLRASTFDTAEHGDPWTAGWNAAKQHAIELLFPLPTPTYSCTFPTDDVSRGLRELAAAPATSRRGFDFSDEPTCVCTTPGCTGCTPGGFEIGGRR